MYLRLGTSDLELQQLQPYQCDIVKKVKTLLNVYSAVMNQLTTLNQCIPHLQYLVIKHFHTFT